MKNIIKRFQISLVLLALFLFFVSACSSDDETVTRKLLFLKNLMNGMTFSQGRRNKYIEHQIECCAGSNQQCAGLV